MPKNKEDEQVLKNLLKNLMRKMKQYGSRSKEVKKFVKSNNDVKEFLDLAATAIFAFEQSSKNAKRKKIKRK